jgi:tRNA-dihydrouridine synthase B
MHALNTPVICLAPLKGITDAIFRTTYAEFFQGIDWAVTPFLTTVKGMRIKPSHLKAVLPENNPLMPVVPQIISKCAENFVSLAQALFDLGYDTVNWNLGCPYPMVAKKGRGAGLLNNPEAVEAFLDRVLPVLTGRLSIKMRLGRQRADEIETLLPLMDRFPIESITIHPRTGAQMYTGRPDLDAFERCLAMTRHKVIYNGDIVCKTGFDGLRDRFGQIGTWMIGRGVMADPFLPAVLKGYSLAAEDCTRRFRGFHDRLLDRYRTALFGPGHVLDRMKGLWTYFSNGFEQGPAIRKRIHKSQEMDQYCQVVDQFLDGGPTRRGCAQGPGY